jgi:hypothetical protein
VYLLIIPLLAALGLVLASTLSLPGAEASRNALATTQMQQYQTFLYTSRVFFAQTASPVMTTAYGWSAIRTAATPAMTQAAIPPHWKAVRRPDGYWVTCTEVAETTVARLPALYPRQGGSASGSLAAAQVVPTGSITLVVGNGGASEGGTPSYVVLGQAGAQASASANLCSAY